ncbi:DUF116 domain-containing protein [Sedimentibacter sp. zth1]|uniref:DUF116 domain-containing protein n=1 Tax=Sedimentibacter sp. zth1 TaxID=2816908 RepID=UPI001A90EBDB|nr:DUF116 domain-containing protein [Sedimentibacter sp. zth1]QSX04850.1 DUF116 domain-containing protein [Sedimentibacter sp. zth1]
MCDKEIYNLLVDKSNSSSYYKKIKAISKNVIDEVLIMFRDELDDYVTFQKISSIEKPRTIEEYGLDVLLIGVLWDNYINFAVGIDSKKANYLKKLKKVYNFKLLNKKTRNNIKGKVLTHNLFNISRIKIDYNIENFRKLIDYLIISDEFFEECIRLEAFYMYFLNLDKDEVENFIKKSCICVEKMVIICSPVLDEYLPNLDIYINDVIKEHQNMEDIIFCSKPKLQYYFNMVGAELMNEVYRSEFIKTYKKMIFLPGCMRYNNDCKSTSSKYGFKCQGCSSRCQINKICNMANGQNIEVYIINHASSLFKSNDFACENIGIIGVSCIANLLSGGWLAKRIGFVPQCVLLDYCGCNHWINNTKVTSLNAEYLMDILGIID